MLRVLEAQAPPKQYASDTISTYSGRLQSATLLEDRREAILGLRSFAKEYPASVASEGLRDLISSLTRDVGDVDTGKIVLETLLALFNPDANSPEADDDVALWVADQFSQKQDNITVLLDMLENEDYFARLYSLRLLGEICSARPERTQECILSAPLGTARLVAILDDGRDAIRSAGLFLLNEVLAEVTSWSFELQKIIAFEEAFDRIFNLIEAEGALAQGGIVVQDCVTLLANLLRFNPSNQSLFREPRILARLASLFREDGDEGDEGDVFGPNENKEKNIWGILAVLRMFLSSGNASTPTNQTAFAKNGIFNIILDLAFSSSVRAPIRAEALKTCAEIIRGNEQLQEHFANNQVPAPPMNAAATGPTANGDAKPLQNGSRAPSRQGKKQEPETVYVMEALLDLILKSSSIAMFDVRLAATECIAAYFHQYTPARHHFLRHAINLHHAESGSENASSNIITVLLAGPHGLPRNDPYRIWFAALLALRLVYDDPEAKAILRAVAEGDESKGEEVVSAIQIITGNLIAAYNDDEDDRVLVAYLQLLCGWLFEHSESVGDLLSEGSTLQELMKIASKPTQNHALAQGLAAALLGIVYEFSTKDCPIPRRSLQPLLDSNVGREQYRERLKALRAQSRLRDFEVDPQSLASAPGPGMLPEVYFDATFVEFLKDNFSRLVRSIDRDPGLEAVQEHEGIDRDLVDGLRGQISDRVKDLEKARSDIQELDGRLANAQSESHKASEGLQAEVRRLNTELGRIKSVNEALQRGHESELEQFTSRHKAELSTLTSQQDRQMKTLKDQHAKQMNDADAAARQKISAAEGSMRAQISNLEQKVSGLERGLNQERQKTEGMQATLARNLDTIKQKDEAIRERDSAAKQKEGEIEKLKSSLQEREQKLKSSTQEVEKRLEASQKDVATARKKQEAAERDGAARAFELEGQLDSVREEMRKKLEDAGQKHDNKEKSIRQEHEKWQSRMEAKVGERDKKIQELKKEAEQKKSAAPAKGGESDKKVKQLEKELKEKEEARASAQGELDDLLMVLGDIEEKRAKDKAKLKELGAEISDDEEGDDDDDDEEEDEDDDEGEDGDGDEEKEEEEKAAPASKGNKDKKNEVQPVNNDKAASKGQGANQKKTGGKGHSKSKSIDSKHARDDSLD